MPEPFCNLERLSSQEQGEGSQADYYVIHISLVILSIMCYSEITKEESLSHCPMLYDHSVKLLSDV